MKLVSKGIRATIAGTVLVALAGCQDSAEVSREPEQEAAAPAKLPISVNAVMVSMVDHASDYLFAIGNGDLPKNDHDWNLVRNSAYETMLAGKVIQMEGTGSNDAAWVANPDWQKLGNELSSIGGEALKLAEAKETEGWDKLGNRLVDNCLACHAKFKPEIPSEGILHEATGRESRGESIFK